MLKKKLKFWKGVVLVAWFWMCWDNELKSLNYQISFYIRQQHRGWVLNSIYRMVSKVSWVRILPPKLTTIYQELEFFGKIFKISRHFSNRILENSTLKNAFKLRFKKVYSINNNFCGFPFFSKNMQSIVGFNLI
jgi:hypothetical protein